MKTKFHPIESFAPMTDQEAEAVVGGAQFPIPGFWRKALGFALELLFDAAFKALKKNFPGRRGEAEA